MYIYTSIYICIYVCCDVCVLVCELAYACADSFMFIAAMRSNYHSLSHEAMRASDSTLSELLCPCGWSPALLKSVWAPHWLQLTNPTHDRKPGLVRVRSFCFCVHFRRRGTATALCIVIVYDGRSKDEVTIIQPSIFAEALTELADNSQGFSEELGPVA